MPVSLSPSDALSPEAFYSLYLGGLATEDETARRNACYVLLSLGRLGLAPDEVLHLHEGWIDWGRGEIHVPARDPCACSECWSRARTRKRQGDDRPLAEIVASEFWSPPDRDGERRLAFGWSNRLTAALDGVLGNGTHLELDHESLKQCIADAARRARNVDPDAVSVTSLRASAVAFLATAGFGPRRLADLCAIDEETAGAFARVGGGEVRNHLYRQLADADPPEVCGENTSYRLVCTADTLAREPFDPARFDETWRSTRADPAETRASNPRPVSPPDGVPFDPDDRLELTEPAGDSGPGLLAESLSEWVANHEAVTDQGGEEPTTATDSAGRQETGNAAGSESPSGAASAADAGSGGETATQTPDAPRGKVTKPVEFSIDARFAAANFEGGRPTGGSVVLAQEELLFLSRDDTGVAGFLRVNFDCVVNVAPGYMPDSLEGLFDDTVGIAYRDDGRQIVVVELDADVRWPFTQTVCERILDGSPAVVTHRPSEPTSVGPEERRIEAGDGILSLTVPDGKPITIHLPMLLACEERKMRGEEGYERGLCCQHLRTDGTVEHTEIRPTDEQTLQFLQRFLELYLDQERRPLRGVTFSAEETDVLEGLYNAGDGRDLIDILDKDPGTISRAADRLEELGLLVRTGGGGMRLTGTGYALVSDEFDL